MSIQSFASRSVERFFVDGDIPRRAGWRGVARIARRKLDMVDYAAVLLDLASPPGNRLEALKAAFPGSTASGSTTNGESSSAGLRPVRPMSTSATITEERR